MYVPAHFNETRVDVMHALMRAHPLATLVAIGERGLTANHVPMEAVAEPAPLGVLRGHIAHANPLWREYQFETEALAIFQGPQTYISPSLYPSKQLSGEVVPTWNYAVVHARGTLQFKHDAAWLRALVGRLTDAHESKREAPWSVSDAPAAYVEKMLELIVGFEFTIRTLTGKWKVGQNRSSADRRGMVEALRGAADADSREIADMLASRGS